MPWIFPGRTETKEQPDLQRGPVVSFFYAIMKPGTQNHLKRDSILVVVFLCLSLVLYFVPTGFEGRQSGNSVRCRGKVITVDNDEIFQQGIVKTGTQRLKLQLLNGPYKGREIEATNQLIGKMELDKFFAEDDIAMVVLSLKEGEIYFATAQDHYRLNVELLLLGCFAILLVAFAGLTGLKALLSFVFAGCMIWKVMIPLFLKDVNPLFISLGVVTLLTSAIIFLVGGLSLRGLVAFLGSLLGIVVTLIMALLFSRGFHVHGAVRPFAETLLYSGYPHLDLTGIFLSGIFISSSGAVMDLAMDVASGLDELRIRKPDLSFLDALRAGFGIGRPVVGTMTTTLLLAYSGGYTALLMMFMAQGVPIVNLLNLNYVAAEILQTLVGSFGLVTVAPFTALVGAFVYTRARETSPAEEVQKSSRRLIAVDIDAETLSES